MGLGIALLLILHKVESHAHARVAVAQAGDCCDGIAGGLDERLEHASQVLGLESEREALGSGSQEGGNGAHIRLEVELAAAGVEGVGTLHGHSLDNSLKVALLVKCETSVFALDAHGVERRGELLVHLSGHRVATSLSELVLASESASWLCIDPSACQYRLVDIRMSNNIVNIT